MSPSRRLDWFTRALALGFLASIAVSGSLWFSNRLYPLVPVAHLLGPFPLALDYAAFAVLVALLLVLLAWPRSQSAKFILLILLAILFLQDQSRLWPSFYEFSFFFLILASTIAGTDREKEDSRILSVCRLLLAAVYLWSGVLKFTPNFYYSTFPRFLAPITAHIPALTPYMPTLALIAAALEVVFALGLLTTRFRRVALWEATFMHMLIFFLIGPFQGDWNDSAWIWSAVTCVFLWVLFYHAPPIRWSSVLPPESSLRGYGAAISVWLALICIGILPGLNLVNEWPSNLSFNIYTGNVAAGEILMSANVVPNLPASLRSFASTDYTGTTLDINAWSAEAFNANVVPDRSVFLALLDTICTYAPPDGTVQLIYEEKSGLGIPSVQSTYSCPAV